MRIVAGGGRPLVVLHGEIKSPPLSAEARQEAGRLLRRVQRGLEVAMPHSRPMPSIGERVHELRINDRDASWRIVYRVDTNAILIVEVFRKKTQQTPPLIIAACKARLGTYDSGRTQG